MKLSTVFELLLICLLIAFAAYGRVIDRDGGHDRLIRSTNGQDKQDFQGISIMSLKQATENVNKYCTCSKNICNCCREFHISLVSTNRRGCVSLQYEGRGDLAVQLSFGDNILSNTIINGKKARAICVPMPGGFSKFCSRIYSIEREDDDHFKACLGLELQSASELEASMRVSCFRFGSDGIRLRPAEKYPIEAEEQPAKNDDNDDDDEDYFELGGDDDDDDDDDDTPLKNTATPTSQTEEDDDDDDDDDYSLGLSSILNFFLDDDDSSKEKTTTSSPHFVNTIPMINKVTTEIPAIIENHSIVSTLKPSKGETVTLSSENPENLDKPEQETTHELNNENTETSTLLDSEVTEAVIGTSSTEHFSVVAEESNDVKYVTPFKKPFAIKKITVGIKEKKPSITSTSANAIENDIGKPSEVTKPDSQHHDDDDDDFLSVVGFDDNDDDKDEETHVEEHEDNEEEEEEEEEHQENTNIENEEDVIINDGDDDDNDDDDIKVLSALISDDNEKKKEKGKIKKGYVNRSTTAKPSDEDTDYEDVAELLSRSLKTRQSKILRL